MTSIRARAALLLPLGLASAAALAAGTPDASGSPSVPVAALAAAAPAAVLDPELAPARAQGSRRGPFSASRAPFAVSFGDHPIAYEVFAVRALPGESVRVSAPEALALRYSRGAAAVAEGGWSWTAPAEPGIAALVLEGPAGEVRLNVLVLHPQSEVKGGALNGYRIGRYLAKPLRGSPRYLPPEGFVEMAPEDRNVLLSPHLTLGQFPCKQPGDPRYLHVTEELLLKLEAILEAANAAGYEAPTFHVMSGFRTPAYNEGIGNETVYSRHLWGDAADVWVDADGDGEMDDWNRDGRVDLADIRILARLAEQVEVRQRELVGGIGLYRRNAAHGPFVHVDARGWAARW